MDNRDELIKPSPENSKLVKGTYSDSLCLIVLIRPFLNNKMKQLDIVTVHAIHLYRVSNLREERPGLPINMERNLPHFYMLSNLIVLGQYCVFEKHPHQMTLIHDFLIKTFSCIKVYMLVSRHFFT